tara:strand:- start:43 stop:480 length:438 start_codon:yes stop_codon:yes gene_type:complete
MKDRKIFKALKIQFESASSAGDTSCVGLRIATLAIIQSKRLDEKQGRKVTDYVGFHPSREELRKWTLNQPDQPITIKEPIANTFEVYEEGYDICCSCGKSQDYGTMVDITEESFNIYCDRCYKKEMETKYPLLYRSEECKEDDKV